MTDIKVNWDQIINLLAQGKPFIWGLLVIALFCLFVLTWVRYEQQMRRLSSFVLRVFSKKRRAEYYRQQETVEIARARYEKFADKIYGLICRISDLQIDGERGRNRFYRYMVKTAFETYYKAYTTVCIDYTEGKIQPELFISYRKTHHDVANKALIDTQQTIRDRLVAEGWDQEKITYVNEQFKIWISAHIGFMRELMTNDETPLEIIKTWYCFFSGMFVDIEKFGLGINGRITGMTFDNVELKGISHE
nr:MAG TPA: hypothetical protein [Inoviridae sp.]